MADNERKLQDAERLLQTMTAKRAAAVADVVKLEAGLADMLSGADLDDLVQVARRQAQAQNDLTAARVALTEFDKRLAAQKKVVEQEREVLLQAQIAAAEVELRSLAATSAEALRAFAQRLREEWQALEGYRDRFGRTPNSWASKEFLAQIENRLDRYAHEYL